MVELLAGAVKAASGRTPAGQQQTTFSDREKEVRKLSTIASAAL
jgi:hypothetical protein